MQLQNGRPENTDGRLDKEIRVYDFLDKLGVEYQRVDHEAAMTMEACEAIDPSTFPTIHAIPCVSLWNPCTNSYARTLEKWTETAPRSKMLCLVFMRMSRMRRTRRKRLLGSPPALTGSVRRGAKK